MPLGYMGYTKSFNYNKRFSFAGDNYFTSTWKTDNLSTGSSNNNQVSLPLSSTGVYNFTVDWGDGNKNKITAYNQTEVTHTYASIGTYTIKIKGIIKKFRFNNSFDRLKLLTIEKWGCIDLGSGGTNFYGCANLVINAKDALKKAESLYLSFRECTSLNQEFTIDTKADNLYGLFYDCTALNKAININIQNVTDIRYLYRGCAAFNKPINLVFPTTATNLYAMLANCTAFNQDISNISLKYITSMDYFLNGATSWSTSNYDAFLLGAYNQAITSGVQTGNSFRCSTKYSLGGAVQAARTYLINIKTWTINDSGGV